MADASTSETKLQQLGTSEREQVKEALKDGLAGRKALMRAYETISDRIKDSETKTMLRRFQQEEQQEYDKAEEICRRYGVDIGGVQNIKNEVVGFLSKAILTGGKGNYGDMRDLAMLYGAESSSRVAAGCIHEVARKVDDDDWIQAVERSRERSRNHMDYLEGRIQELGRDAFGLGTR